MFDWLIDFFNSLGKSIESSTISLEGATLMAEVYPVGIIACLVQVRIIGRTPRDRRGFIFSRASAGAIASSSLPALVSMWSLIRSVSEQVPLHGWATVLPGIGGTLMLGGLIPLAIELVWSAWGSDTTTAQRAEQAKLAAAQQPAKPERRQPHANPKNRPTPKQRKRRGR